MNRRDFLCGILALFGYGVSQNEAYPKRMLFVPRRLTDTEMQKLYRQIAAQHSLGKHTGLPIITHSGLRPT